MKFLQGLSPVAVVTLSIMLVEHVTTVTLTRFTQQRDGVPRLAPTVAVLLTEMLKMMLALVLELNECRGLGSGSNIGAVRAAVIGRPCDTLRLSVPSGMYTVQNIAIFIALGNLEVVIFQVLYQTKLLLTALLSVFFLRRKLSVGQWLSLAILTCGVIAVELSDGSKKSSPPPAPPPQPDRHHAHGRALAALLADVVGGGPPTGALPPPHLPPSHLSSLDPAGGGLGAAVAAVAHLGVGRRAGSGEAGAAVGRRLRGREREKPAAGSGEAGAAVGGGLRGREREKQQGPPPRTSSSAAAKQHWQRTTDPASADAAAADEEVGGGGGGGGGGGAGKGSRNEALGTLVVMLAATLSSCAGIYFEAIVKNQKASGEAGPVSLWVRNVQMCVFSIPLAAYAVYTQRAHIAANGGALRGLDAYSSTLIGLNASGGLLVAAVIKYGDNILKNFTTSCSVIIGSLISVALFGFRLTGQFVWGSALVLFAAYMYGVAGHAPEAKPNHKQVPQDAEMAIELDGEDDEEG